VKAEQPQTPIMLGKYHLVEKLAVGGMAEVFLACEKAHLERLVVIKRILPHLAEQHGFVEMFFQEARIAARINHPNVVQIYELGESGTLPFIAMEYVPGSTLKQLLYAAADAEVRLPTEVVLALGLQALAGVHAAHELKDTHGTLAGLVHRDVSPHNLMVTNEGHVKLLDFGIAKATESTTAEETRTGMLKGKISYMSPEQALQDPIDRRSDLFSMGAVLWELFAGQKLFQGKGELATMQKIVQGNARELCSIRPDVDPHIAAVIHKALRLNRDERWTDASEMRSALSDAGRNAGLKADQDRAALMIQTLLGEEHRQRKQAVSDALDRTLVTLSMLQIPDEPTVHTTGVAVRAGVMGAVASAATIAAGALAVCVLAFGAWVWIQPQELLPEVVYEGTPVKIAIAAPTSAELLGAEYEPLRRYLANKLKRNIELVIDENYQVASDLLISQEVDFASLPPNTYVQAKLADPGISVLVIKEFDGSSGTDGYLLVQEDSPAVRIQDLKGKTICHPNELSTTGYVLPRSFIKANGMDPDADFEKHMSGNHYQVMRDVISGICEVGCTYNGAHITADEAGIQVSTLRVLTITGRTPHDAMTAGSETDAELAQAMKQALLDFDPMEHIGRERMGSIERVTGFLAGDDTNYDGLRTALRNTGQLE
jgi:phosphate/phosphite/phosphonate ABC transporter binding protein